MLYASVFGFDFARVKLSVNSMLVTIVYSRSCAAAEACFEAPASEICSRATNGSQVEHLKGAGGGRCCEKH